MASRLSPCLRATSPRLLRDAARVHPGRRRRNAGGGVWLSLPQPLWAAPQAGPRASHRLLAGTVAMPSGLPGLGPSSPRSCLIAGATGGPLRQGRSGAASPVGRDHASGAAPCRASATPTAWGRGSPSWHLGGACCSPQRVVSGAALQRLIGSLPPQGVPPCFPAACTAHRADAGGRQLQALVRLRLGLQSCLTRMRFSYALPSKTYDVEPTS